MTATARQVLSDCEVALRALEAKPRGVNWRLAWLAAVTLLRAVGHVLNKVDGATDAFMQRAIKEAWIRWSSDKKANAIFFDFVEQERNSLLKEYLSNARQEIAVMPNGPIVGLVMFSGPFKGREQLDVIREAIAWWERELDEIEIEAAKLRLLKEGRSV